VDRASTSSKASAMDAIDAIDLAVTPVNQEPVHRDIDHSAVNMVTSYIGSHQCQALVASSNLKFQCLIKRIDP